MSAPELFKTAYGDVELAKLIKAYEAKKAVYQNNKDYYKAYFASEKGKEVSLRNAKKYYITHKEEVLRKRREKYHKMKAEKEAAAPEQASV
jgi:hypothetical protein